MAPVLRSAELEYQAIILSVDVARSLSGSLDVPLANQPRLVSR